MADVAKHDSEGSGERGHCENRRIEFLVSGDSVGVDDLLEGLEDLIAEEGRGDSDSLGQRLQVDLVRDARA